MDIFAGLTLPRPSKNLACYQRLLTDSCGLWSSPLDDSLGLRMESLSGCPDEVLLAIVEISALSNWKSQEEHSGCLSVRELVRRGESIEQQLRRTSDSQAVFAELEQVAPHPRLPSIDLTQMPMASGMVMGGSPAAASSGQTGLFPDEGARRLVAEIFMEAAVLYLNTVLSGSNPSVPEILASVDRIADLLRQLPQSEVDRSLVFSICLAGCLSSDPSQRDIYKMRLQALDESFGNPQQTQRLMEAVWQRRDVHGGVVDWRDMMREEGLNILLV